MASPVATHRTSRTQLWTSYCGLHSCVLSGILLSVIALVCCVEICVQSYLEDYECEMTYMYWKPKYIEIVLPDQMMEQFPQYRLFVYGEAGYAKILAAGHLRGIPVLYIPGNGGSHQQVRSAASIAYLMHPREFPRRNIFNFFTITFNEELSGVYGGVLQRQTEFAAHCIDHILSLYQRQNMSTATVPILAHSMGGVVARALFSIPWFNPMRVRLIITMATPHLRPIIPLDHHLQEMYANIVKAWQSDMVTNVTLVSVNGGWKDSQVLSMTSRVTLRNSLNAACSAVPRVWASSGHQEIVWCRRLQLALVRSLFQLQNQSENELSSDPQHIRHQFCQVLLNPCPLPPPTATGAVSLQGSVEPMNTINYFSRGLSNGDHKEARWKSFNVSSLVRHMRYVMVAGNRLVSAASDGWLWTCNSSSDCVDMSSQAIALPPTFSSNHKVVVVDLMKVSSVELVVEEPPEQDGHSPHKVRVIGVQDADRCLYLHRQLIAQVFVLVCPFYQSNVSVELPVLTDSFTLQPKTYFSLITLHSPHPPLVVQQIDLFMQCEGAESDLIGQLVAGIYPSSVLKAANVTKSDGDGMFVAQLGVALHPSEVLDDNVSLLLWVPTLECRLQVSIGVDFKGTVLQFILRNVVPLLQVMSLLSLVRLMCQTQPHSILWDGLVIMVMAGGGVSSHFEVHSSVCVVYFLCCCVHSLAVTVICFLGNCKGSLSLWCFQSPALYSCLCLVTCACCYFCGSLGLIAVTVFMVVVMAPQQLHAHSHLLASVACAMGFTLPSFAAWSGLWRRSVSVIPHLRPDPFAIAAAVLSVLLFSLLCKEEHRGTNMATSKHSDPDHSVDLGRMVALVGWSTTESAVVIASYQFMDLSLYLWLLAGVMYIRLNLQ